MCHDIQQNKKEETDRHISQVVKRTRKASYSTAEQKTIHFIREDSVLSYAERNNAELIENEFFLRQDR